MSKEVKQFGDVEQIGLSKNFIYAGYVEPPLLLIGDETHLELRDRSDISWFQISHAGRLFWTDKQKELIVDANGSEAINVPVNDAEPVVVFISTLPGAKNKQVRDLLRK